MQFGVEGGRRLKGLSFSDTPLVSIVSVVFRAAKELPPLLDSILQHKGDDCELIVIDGGSDDGTVDVLRRYDDQIDYWLSEPDRGIYDAMNKGVLAARGHYILHLNAGDRLLSIPREQLRKCLAENVDLAVFSVDVEDYGIHRPRSSPFLARIAMPWHHQGSFYRREGHLGYDLQFAIRGDFDLNQRMMMAGKTIRCFFDTRVAFMGAGGAHASNSLFPETVAIVRKNFGRPYAWLAYLFNCIDGFIPRMKRVYDRLKSQGSTN